MNYNQIDELIKSKFDEGDNLKAEYKNGLIIISMKHEKNIWTKDQEKWLNENVVTKLENYSTQLEENNKLLKDVLNKFNQLLELPTIKKEINQK